MASPEERFKFETGKTPVSAVLAQPEGALAGLVIAHGAGAGMDHPFLVGFSRAMNDEGVATLRFNFPYWEARRRSTDSESVAVASWRAAFDAASSRFGDLAVFAGGKSYGGRLASSAGADGNPAAGPLFLCYPLPP